MSNEEHSTEQPDPASDAAASEAASSEASNGRLRSCLGNLLVLAVSLLLAFALGEVVVRVLYGDEMVLYPRYHTDYRYGDYTLRGNRPNSTFRHRSIDGEWTFVTNSAGMRNTQDFPYEKSPGVVRVLSLGDSQTQGHEVRQQATYSAVLERALTARGTEAEVLNAGVSGFSTAEALVYLENEGWRYSPDVVVLGFFANDFEDNVKADLFRLEADGSLAVNRLEHIPGVRIQNLIYAVPFVGWLGEHSYLYSLAFNTTWSFFKTRLAEQARERTDSAAVSDNVQYALPTRAHTAAEVALAVALLERMHEFCASRGIRLIVVDIPSWVDGFRTSPSLPPAMLPALDSAGIEYVDSRTLIGDHEGGPYLHVPHGYHHISEFTHGLIGTEIARRMTADSGSAPLAGRD